MPGRESHVRAESFASRRRHQPSHLLIVPSHIAQDGSGCRPTSYERQRPFFPGHSTATALSTPGILLQPTNRSTSSDQKSCPSNDSACQSRDYNSLDNEMIGIALGSPSESPLPPLPSAGPDDSSRCYQSPASVFTVQSGSVASTNKPESGKPRGTNWKTLGGLLGKKVHNFTTPPLPFYQAKPFPQGDHLQQKYSQVPQSCEATKTSPYLGPDYTKHNHCKNPSRPSPTVEPFKAKDGGPRRKRSLRKMLGEKNKAPSSSPTYPQSRMGPLLEEGSEESPAPPPKDKFTIREPVIVKLNGGSLLEVEIPSVQLERFSIMFETLLQPQQQAVLFARGRGQLDQLKSMNNSELKANIISETQDLPLPGRSRSTSSADSPAVSFFPPAPPSRDSSPGWKRPLKRSPLHRSATAIGLASPYNSGLKLDYGTPQSQKQNEALPAVHTTLEDLKALETSQRPKNAHNPWRYSQTSTEASFHSASETQLIQTATLPTANNQGFPKRTTSVRESQQLKSARNGSKLSEVADAPAARSQLVRVASSAVTRHQLGGRPFPDLQPLTLNPPTPRIAQLQPGDTRYKALNKRQDPLPVPQLPLVRSNSAEGLRKAAEISIAQQISFSHRQRELLVPIVPKAAKQPMAVDVQDRYHGTRKSQHLILEDA